MRTVRLLTIPELIRLYEKVGFEQINENTLKRKE